VLASYLALPDMPREPDYEAELAFVADASSPHAEGLLPGESSFRMLGVDTAAQGRGVGEALTRRCLAEAVEVGSDAVFIHSGTWMHTAHRLYRRLGFEFVPERDWHFDSGIHLLGMHRQL
jgi:ribosomal protein S18 acetylase RimI-like enzyme